MSNQYTSGEIGILRERHNASIEASQKHIERLRAAIVELEAKWADAQRKQELAGGGHQAEANGYGGLIGDYEDAIKSAEASIARDHAFLAQLDQQEAALASAQSKVKSVLAAEQAKSTSI